jgi:hypothetical protein
MSDGWITIGLNEGRWWNCCPMCEQERQLDHAVGWYCGPVKLDLGTRLPNGDEVGGMRVCRLCHDEFYGEDGRD